MNEHQNSPDMKKDNESKLKCREGLKPSDVSSGSALADQHCTEQSELFVIGAGLMRTGTTSLKVALEILYGRPCYHMSEVFSRFKQTHIKAWLWAFDRLELSDDQIPLQFWDNVYKGYCAAVDYPTCAFLKILMEVYPQAKIILTSRSPEDWVSSCRATMLSSRMLKRPTFGERLACWRLGIRQLFDLHDTMFAKTLGSNYYKMNDQELKNAYLNWNASVMRTIETNRLLIFDPNDGWEPLCEFLHLPQPGVPYPHLNKREGMAKVLSKLLDEGKLNRRIILSSAAAIVIAALGFVLHAKLTPA